MTVNIELTPEMEAALATQAAAQGISLPEYLRRLLEEQTMPDSEKALSPANRAAYWRESVNGLPDTMALPDEAVSLSYSARNAGSFIHSPLSFLNEGGVRATQIAQLHT